MKEKQSDFWDNTLSRKGLFVIFCIVAFLLFLKIIWEIYNATVVGGILSKIEAHWTVDILFLLLTAFTIGATIHAIRANKRLSNTFFYIATTLFLLFFYCRFFSRIYTYKQYTFSESLNYIDYFVILFACVLLIKVRNWINSHQPPVYKNSPFLVDKPIEVSGDDKFSRKIFAQKIAEKIQSKLFVENAGALAIGINGQWGTGKTSFTNMIKESIDNENRIVIDFNPWRSSSSSKIIEDFFELLIAEIRPYDPSLSNSIAEYAKTLTKIEENIFTKSTGAIADFLFEEKSKNEIYDSINSSIARIKKQLIVFIDDLDRLDKKEIIEVLRLVRNTANFNNVVYVVSYDKGYIQTAIKDFNEYNFKSFLEKIFQFEFSLPMYEHGVLRTEIKKLLKAGLEEKFHSRIDWVVDSRAHFGINFTNEIVKTYRDVIRLVNSILFEIDTVKEEVFFYDFFLLQLLKLEYPKVYEAVIDNRNLFFTNEGKDDVYRLKKESEAWSSDDVLSFSKAFKNDSRGQPHQEEKEISSFEAFLRDNTLELSLSGYDKKLLYHLIETLLSLKEDNEGPQNNELYKSFAYPENFHKYFAYRLYEGDISAKEFEEYRRKDFEDYKAKALQWISEGKYSLFVDRLAKVEDFSTVHEFENQIRILLAIGNYQLKQANTNPFWVDYTLTLKSLEYPFKKTQRIRLYSSIEEYRQFFFKTFNEAEMPAIYESHVLARAIAGRINIGLSNEEISAINLSYFKRYCDTNNDITSDFRQLHSNSIRAVDGYQKDYEIIPEAQVLFVSYFLKNLKGRDLAGFIRHTNPGSDDFHMEYDWLKRFFPDPVYTNLENYLNNTEAVKEEKNYYEEFMRFYELFKASEYKPVEFVFEYLEPSLWTGGTKSNPTI